MFVIKKMGLLWYLFGLLVWPSKFGIMMLNDHHFSFFFFLVHFNSFMGKLITFSFPSVRIIQSFISDFFFFFLIFQNLQFLHSQSFSTWYQSPVLVSLKLCCDRTGVIQFISSFSISSIDRAIFSTQKTSHSFQGLGILNYLVESRSDRAQFCEKLTV